MAEEADLYDDLFPGEHGVDDATPFETFHKSDTREEEFRKKEAELNGKVELLQTEVEALQQVKAVLTRNISCLFKTAQMELARKDKQMKELRDENSRFKLGAAKGQTNAKPFLNKAAPIDKILGQDEKNHHGRQEKRLGSNGNRGSVASSGVNSEESRERRRHMQTSLDEGKKRERDANPDKNLPSDSRPGDTSRYDGKVVRHSKGRSPDQRIRDRRDTDNSRKRHRSLSRERDEDSGRSGAAKAAIFSRGSRERRSSDHSDRYGHK